MPGAINTHNPYRFHVGSFSPRAQLLIPANSFFGALGIFSIVLKISSRSAFGLIILPPFVGMPLIGARRLQGQVFHQLSYTGGDLLVLILCYYGWGKKRCSC